MTDKAVSTEDLYCVELPRTSLDAARLEAVIKTLVENKVEALKNQRKSSSIASSPKSLLNRLRITSTSSVSSRDKDEPSTHSQSSKVSVRRMPEIDEIVQKPRRSGQMSPSCMKVQHPKVHNCDRLHFHDDDIDDHENWHIDCSSETCYCRRDTNGEIRMHFDEDYISLKIDEGDDMDERALRRAQRKRRRRRKRRMKRHQMALNAIQMPAVNEKFKEIDPDELSKRARWTIVITACLLLFMCLLLVGITLRMAPIIDDMDASSQGCVQKPPSVIEKR